MKTFTLACVIALVLAVTGALILNNIQEPVDQAFTTSGVRLDS